MENDSSKKFLLLFCYFHFVALMILSLIGCSCFKLTSCTKEGKSSWPFSILILHTTKKGYHTFFMENGLLLAPIFSPLLLIVRKSFILGEGVTTANV